MNTRLYLGEGENQPLLVGLGGAEGGNAWTSDVWQQQRDRFMAEGYAFLALAYFGEEGVPSVLDQIALEAVYDAIAEAAAHPKINQECIGLIGGSKGAELALALASHYPEVRTVVGIVPGNAVFAGHTDTMDTSSFSWHGEQLPFVPVPESAGPALIKGDLRAAWEEMLKDEEAVRAAAIQVEKINGPIFLLSATQDEFWPSTEMSEAMIRRLDEHSFGFAKEHVAIEGNHAAPLQQMDLVEDFLRVHFCEP